MKKFILLLSLLSSLPLLAQENIEAEILEFDVSKSLLISKGRGLLMDKFTDGDWAKVKEIDAYLIAQEDDDFFALYPAEQWLIQYWVQDYQDLCKRLEAYDKTQASNYSDKTRPEPDSLYYKLIEKSRASSDHLIAQINQSDLNSEDKSFLVLSFKNIIADLYSNPYLQDSLNTEADVFIEKHPESRYKNYTKQYVRLKYQPSIWGFAFEFFSGYGIFTDQLSEYYNNPVPIGLAFDICYNKVELYLRNYIGLSSAAQKLSYNPSESYAQGSNLYVLNPEASLGYATIDNNTFKLSPFLGISAMNVTPPKNSMKETPELENIELDFTATYTLGLNFNLKFGAKKSPRYMTDSNYGFIRLRYSYHLPQFDNKYAMRNGGFHNITIGFGGMARRLTRDL